MSESDDTRTAARRATDERFADVVMTVNDRYPDRTAFVAADSPGLADVLGRNLAERRATAIVHDDGSEILIEPPEFGRAALLLILILGALIHARPKVEAEGQVIELPLGTRVRWRAREALAA